MKYFTIQHACMALLAACISTNALAQEAKWEPFSPDNYFREGDGVYFGPGVATARFTTCAIKMTLLNNETLHVEPSSASILIYYVFSPEGYAGSYGLGCYTGKKMENIRADFSAPDGSLGLSAHQLERRQESPELNTSAVFFNGKNWQGVGITEDFWTFDDPVQNIRLCLFGERQALCAFTAAKRLDDPDDKGMEDLLDQLSRIEFLEPEN